MIEIAIIDDEALFCQKMKEYILNIKTGYSYNIDYFTDPRKFIQKKKEYDIALIDIDMPYIDGISLSKSLTNEKTLVIYVTNHIDKMEDAFGINVFKYLLKSKLENKFESIFLDAVNQLSLKDSIWIKSEGEMIRIRLNDIVYAVYYHRDIYLHTNANTEIIVRRKNLSEFIKMLDDNFILINRNTVINTSYIISYKKMLVKLEKYDLTFEVSRTNKNAVFQAVMKKVDKLA